MVGWLAGPSMSTPAVLTPSCRKSHVRPNAQARIAGRAAVETNLAVSDVEHLAERRDVAAKCKTPRARRASHRLSR